MNIEFNLAVFVTTHIRTQPRSRRIETHHSSDEIEDEQSKPTGKIARARRYGEPAAVFEVNAPRFRPAGGW